MNHISQVVEEDIKKITEKITDISPRLSGKTVLIAGGAGFLGKYLVLTLDYLNEYVLEKPCNIIILDNYISGLRGSIKEKENIKMIEQNISNPFKIDGKIDYIIHAASIASPVFYHKFRLETIDVGFIGTRNLLELAKEKKVESFLFMSSSEVYGDPDPKFIPTNEKYQGNVSCIGPRACYDEPKRIGETLCMVYADLFNLPVKIVRPFNIFGPGMRLDDGRVIPNFVTAALRREKIPVYAGGHNTRTFCYVTDATAGFFQVLLSPSNKEVFNIGNDEQEIQMKHLAEIVSGLVENEEIEIHHSDGSIDVYSKSNPNRRCPDLTKIRTLVGYTINVNLITGLKRFIRWVREENDESNYGIQKKCKSCGCEELKKVISLGNTPLANSLLSKEELNKEELYPLEMKYCPNCHLCQLSYFVNPKKMFKNYLYVTSTTKTFNKHFEDMAREIKERLKFFEGDLVVDIGSNDGLLLKKFKELGMRVIGVEPAENICEIARKDGIDTLCDFFNENSVEEIIKIKGKASLITGNNVFAHISEINKVVENVKDLLRDDGAFVIEVQYLLDMMKNLNFDNIYHEHLYYYSLISLSNFFNKKGMEIFRVEHINTHGGSLRVFIQKKGGKNLVDFSVEGMLKEEKLFGLDKFENYEKFAQEIYLIRDKIKNQIKILKLNGNKIVGYGAPAKATTLLNFYEIGNESIDYIIEENPLKINLFVPGVKIPIVDKNYLERGLPDYVLILAWNFADEIINKNEDYLKRGVKFIVPSKELKERK